MTIYLNSSPGKLVISVVLEVFFLYFVVFFSLVPSYGAYSSVSPFCLTQCVYSYELDEVALSPNFEKLPLFRSGLCVVCELGGFDSLVEVRGIACGA